MRYKNLNAIVILCQEKYEAGEVMSFRQMK